jgi:predicted RNA-binding protein with PIN domain
MPQVSPRPVGVPETGLPEAVLRRVLELAAGVLGGLDDADVPPALRQVRRFAPSRRARAGSAPLIIALERDDDFREQVARAARDLDPVPARGACDPPPDDADPLAVAVLAYLTRAPDWPDLAARAAARLRARADHASARQDAERGRVGLELARERAAVAEAALDKLRREGLDEALALRRELRRQRSAADRARSAAREAEQQADQEQAAARSAVQEMRTRVRRVEGELADARAALAAMRRVEREARSLAGSRARLLLDTVVEAAAGLGQELGLGPIDVHPADLVGHDPVLLGEDAASTRAREPDDPSVLTELLTLPRAHLVVDGYNVTKGAYGDLPLADQRARLLTGLSGLNARTRAEITCCFDGAAVAGRVGGSAVRGVRLRFSEPGTTADDLIRRLVLAEPPGRVVVVVSSDREVADGVRARGARPVSSGALARLLERS